MRFSYKTYSPYNPYSPYQYKNQMKKIYLPLLAITALLAGCGQKKTQTPQAEAPQDSIEEADTSHYGLCGEATTMHTLQLISGADTLLFALCDGDSLTDVQGGLTVGDTLAVVGGAAGEALQPARKVVNITSLMGRWVALDRQFALLPDGKVESQAGEPHAPGRWRLLNGRLILPPDTFDIATLGPDSLYLHHHGKTLGFRRM